MLLASERHRGGAVARTVVGVQVSQAGAVGGADAGGKIRAGGSGLIEPRLASRLRLQRHSLAWRRARCVHQRLTRVAAPDAAGLAPGVVIDEVEELL